ncbi:SPOR domain-containing protein [Shinella pollutisoli]|uniref:SPOR domain-containing protein n=1 Tax=Shinella pollutisoli TaxID=2250594 RepID=A0ABV7DEF5_9HYPH|nr:SPOR domain-containing protein [Shinella pollutisoli]
MADKNFARSGAAGNDFLADDDPLSELARLVGYEPRPVQPVVTPLVEPVQPVERHANPVLALEDELMRAFEQYDAPRRRAAVEPVLPPEPENRPVEPVFEAPAPEAEDRDAVLDAVPDRDEAHAPALSREYEEDYRERAPEYDTGLLLADEVEGVADEVPAVDPVPVSEPLGRHIEPAFEAFAPEVDHRDADAAPGYGEAHAPARSHEHEEDYREPAPEYDAGLLLADEVEGAVDEVPAVDPVPVSEPVGRHAEPVFEAFAPEVEHRDAVLDTVPGYDEAYVPALSRDDEENYREPAPEYDAGPLLADEVESVADEVPAVDPLPVSEPVGRHAEPAFEAFAPEVEHRDADAAPGYDEAYAPALSREHEEDYRERAPEYDAGLLLADEVESAVDEVPAVEAGHPGHAFAERLEPRFEVSEPLVETVEDEVPSLGAAQEPVFLGLQPADDGVPDIGADLERELELSIGEGFAAAMTPGPDVPAGEAAWLDEPPADAEPFLAAEPAYAEAAPQFLAELPREAPEEHARARAEAEAQWQADAEPAFEPEPAYAVETVARGGGYDHDELLAEVERFPVPEARSPLSGVTPVADATLRAASIFSRATPVVHREPVRREPEAEPVVAGAPEPAEAEPEIDFDNFELDLADIDLDLDPAELMVDPFPQAAEAEAPVEEEKPAPVVAVPVSTYTAPQPVAAETADGALPFDPTMIAETDEGVTPVTELDVPQLPVIEKEKPPVHHADYDFDIDAEMAQLFAAPDGKPAEDAASAAHPAAHIAEVDDFERALEEDFRRSLSEPERMAIPVDPGPADGLYAGDGYDEVPPAARRGLLIAASLAGLLLVGGGGVYAWMSLGGGVVGSGEPRVILADKEPVKIVPEEKGGKTVPNQDKAVYDRVAGNTDATPQQDQLVTTTEEPVDVVQRTLTPETLPFDGPAEDDGPVAEDDEGRLLPGVDEPATAGAEDGRTPLVSPRKVKTMIVKPDGTLVAREVDAPETEVAAAEAAPIDAKATATTAGAAAEAVATVDETARLAADADASLRAEQEAAEAEPRSALAEVADIEVEDTAPVRVVKTTTVGKTDGKAPVPETRPVDQPVTVVGTVTENGNLAATPAADATPTATSGETQVAAVSPGGYVVQIASLPSEAEAQKSYNTLSAKFASVIGGRGVDIRKAEIPNKGTYYRVRIPAGSREEANSLCNRYKSAGGSCLVTR